MVVERIACTAGTIRYTPSYESGICRGYLVYSLAAQDTYFDLPMTRRGNQIIRIKDMWIETNFVANKVTTWFVSMFDGSALTTYPVADGFTVAAGEVYNYRLNPTCSTPIEFSYTPYLTLGNIESYIRMRVPGGTVNIGDIIYFLMHYDLVQASTEDGVQLIWPVPSQPATTQDVRVIEPKLRDILLKK